jgi:predicted AAA+ superfamily ATPase
VHVSTERQPWYQNFSKKIVKSPKVYLCNTGLFCFLHGENEGTLSKSPFAGFLWETFVFSEIRKQNRLRKSPKKIWFYRDQRAREIDFILEGAGKVHFLECKWTELTNS